MATGRLLLALHGALQALHMCHKLQLLYAVLLQSWWPLMLEVKIVVFRKTPLNISYTASKLHTKHLQQSVEPVEATTVLRVQAEPNMAIQQLAIRLRTC